MTQLARLVPARSKSVPELTRAGPEASAAGATRPVPSWAIVSAALAPVLLVGGWLVAGVLQPASYSPMRQTMSVLAGQTGTDRWVMTAALFLVGASQIVTGLGLTIVPMPARVLLILTGLSTIGIAACPEPTTGPTPLHLAFAVSCAVTTAIWPWLVVSRDPAGPWLLSPFCCATVTLVFALLSGWLLIATQGGGDLGLVERLTSTAQGLWPLIVALALRQVQEYGASN